MLSGTNIRTRRPCKKLEYKQHGPFENIEVITETAIHRNLSVTWKIHKGFHLSLLDPFTSGHREVNLEKVLDTAHSIDTDDEYHIDKGMGSVKNKGKVSCLVNLREFPAKKDWASEIYENLCSV
jgi:hypothetical protein